ncbi:MAG: ATP-binding cassette domain-containing protein [Chloroflexaceae bacterium]|nr:ATP-binding cassette domain-containing protein [Chloroflexaceae bacterium]
MPVKQAAVILATQGLGRQVGGKTLVDAIALALHAGEIVAMIGPSGSGKSSLLRLLNRLDEPTSGTVLLWGEDYRTLPPRQLRSQVGLVMQQPYLFRGSVADNIRFGPRQRQMLLDDATVDGLLDSVGLTGYGQRDVKHLSGGEAQRVAIVRTLANQPHVLLLDEPTSALDEASEQIIERVLVGYVSQQQAACLLVSHRPEQVQRLAQRVLSMDRGHLTAIEETMEHIYAESMDP